MLLTVDIRAMETAVQNLKQEITELAFTAQVEAAISAPVEDPDKDVWDVL